MNWENPPKSTLERGEEWIRGEELESPKPLHTRPPRTWSYYLAWVLMFLLLFGFLTGTGALVLKRGQNVIQRYIEKIEYGLDIPDDK